MRLSKPLKAGDRAIINNKPGHGWSSAMEMYLDETVTIDTVDRFDKDMDTQQLFKVDGWTFDEKDIASIVTEENNEQ